MGSGFVIESTSSKEGVEPLPRSWPGFRGQPFLALPAPPVIPRLPAPRLPLLLGWVRPVEVVETTQPVVTQTLPVVTNRAFTTAVAQAVVAEATIATTDIKPAVVPETRAEPAPPAFRQPEPEPPPPALSETPRWDDPFAAPRDERSTSSPPTTPEPDPWSIMPSRTLRGAGLRRQSRHVDEPQIVETLQEAVEKEGPVVTPQPAPVDLWDILIVPNQDGFRTSEQGVKALILYLDRAQLLRSPTVLSLEEFVGHPQHGQGDVWRQRLRGAEDDTRLISLDAGVFAHQIFYEGAAPSGGPAVKNAHIGTRSKPACLPFGPETRQAAFWLALVGCRFDTPSRGFLERLHSILYLRPVVYTSPHRPGP